MVPKGYSQSCDVSTPSYNVDLTTNPDTVWISLAVTRSGRCCGLTGSVKCVEFIVTLADSAEAVIFDIYSGPAPPGALFYQVNCGAQISIGEKLCLAGVGSHVVTFCKPGGGTNKYMITSIPTPTTDNSITVNEACTGQITTSGYETTTISFSNNSSSATQYDWDLGDGNTSTAFNPINTYLDTGWYTVTLIADNPECDPDTLIKVKITSLDLSGYPAGIYFLQFKVQDQEATTKITLF